MRLYGLILVLESYPKAQFSPKALHSSIVFGPNSLNI